MPPAPTSQPLVIETPRAEAPVRTKSDARCQLPLTAKPSNIWINFLLRMEDSAKIGTYMRALLDSYESLRGRTPDEVKKRKLWIPPNFCGSGRSLILGPGCSECRGRLSRGLVRGPAAAEAGGRRASQGAFPLCRRPSWTSSWVWRIHRTRNLCTYQQDEKRNPMCQSYIDPHDRSPLRVRDRFSLLTSVYIQQRSKTLWMVRYKLDSSVRWISLSN